ncbi:MAG: hypothetical protein KME64_02320 [Scytonematopsis contorta HA4267-MV1]|nr:hypothetical protein [Scytonematopsis contorta HA4267-MV1]
MDILIESTKAFEEDLAKLSEDDKAVVIKKINGCTSLFTTDKANLYKKMRHLNLPSFTNGYESSLYALGVSEKLIVILTVDEDPIFEQVIFTLFRVSKHEDIDKAYKSVAESLYQDFLHQNRETAQML